LGGGLEIPLGPGTARKKNRFGKKDIKKGKEAREK